ncbi:putative disease resistance protein RGA3 [Lolium rigidum]|uniref:putative disease resistance protein RGA3 n=1 Tax=Lolium rigidum TaxID=89674 RepID=UPI001F5DA816|nr:putative disease resistance protein RGA3 [Lolium rigidum]
MAEVGAMLASAVGKHIACKLGDLVKDEIALLWGFEEDVEGMREKMEDLEAVMHDADDRMRRGERDGKAVGRWLAKFKSVAYDVEDVLDELDANELINNTQSKVKLFFSGNNQLVQRATIAHDMKTVRGKIDQIVKEGQTLNLARHEARPEGSRNKETFAASRNIGMKNGMVGRDMEKEKIISLLLKSEANEDISIIPIIGLGGLGKSTLAESVLADQRVNVFDVNVWVHVSEQFNLHNIGSSIMKGINSSISLENCTLQFLHDNLQKELSTTRYLIVLDDLWEEDGQRLEELKRMLQYGCKGSKIIVTTRSKSVVQNLSTGFLANSRKICLVTEPDQINLGVLSPMECWEVMKQRALGPDDNESGLHEIGREIAARCGGIPLVANALGQVMFELRTVTAWEDIRDIKVDLGLREVHQNNTLERLMLSYYYMKMEFKMCFTYLAAFRKGFVVDARHLIQQWMALGYIHGYDDGERCINYLLGMSFLQLSRSPSVGPVQVHGKGPGELTMHDLVHELASIIIANELLLLDANGTKPKTWNKASFCRHAQLINYQNQPNILEDIPTKVRSLHFSNPRKLQLPQMAFSRSKYMRILDLSGCSAGVKSTPSNLNHSGSLVDGQSTSRNIVLPSSLHHSKLLRYLDATALPIKSIPKSFHTLQHMQTLILSQCSIESLPDNICSLQKLCHLDLSSNISLNELPVSLGKLSKLSFLNLLGCSILQELPESICEMTSLRHLDMSECIALRKLPDKFGSLPKLIFLNLSGCSKLTKLPDSVRLRSLEHLDLSNCHVLEYLPKDFGNLQNLGFLNLSGCYKVSLLPESFWQLIHLKFLDLSDCHDLRELPESFGNLFELEFLIVASCCKLKLLPESLCQLLKLRHLNLSYCLRLENLPSSIGDLKLELLDISGVNCKDLPDSIRDLTTLNQLLVSSAQEEMFDKACDIKKHLNLPGVIVHEVHQLENKGYSSIVELAQLTCHELTIVELQNVMNPKDAERAKLRDKSDLHSLHLAWGVQCENDKCVLERLIPPRTLEQFSIWDYMSKDFPNWMYDISSYLPSLTFLKLSGLGTCHNLPPVGLLANLRSLHMENIPNITKIGKEFYGEGGTCRKLRVIRLESMENLVEWWTTQSSEENEESLIPNLHTLDIGDCPKLKFLPYPPRSMFWLLDNSSMIWPKRGFGKLSSSTLPFKMVVQNCNFAPHKWDRLQHLPTLEIFEVYSCNGLRMFPDVIGCLTSLTRLHLRSLMDLEILPECLGNLTSLEHFIITNCPQVTSLPESMKNLTALTELWLKKCNGLYVLPEWLGQLESLQEFNIIDCPNLKRLPESIQSLTKLEELYIWGCPSLVGRCQWEDANMISRIPKVTLRR